MTANSPDPILPSFRHLEALDEARAISEPFVRGDAYTNYPAGDLADIEPVAVVAAYLDAGSEEFAFGLAANVRRPYATAQAFMQGYEYVGRAQRDFENARATIRKKGYGDLAAEGQADAAEMIKRKTLEAGLQTMVAFAVYETPDTGRLASALWVPRRIAEEVPMEGREAVLNVTQKYAGDWAAYLATSDSMPGVTSSAELTRAATQAKTLGTDDAQAYGVLRATERLPAPEEVEGYLNEEDVIGDFFSLTRKERRVLLNRERKQA